jgi:hypothetical protein
MPIASMDTEHFVVWAEHPGMREDAIIGDLQVISHKRGETGEHRRLSHRDCFEIGWNRSRTHGRNTCLVRPNSEKSRRRLLCAHMTRALGSVHQARFCGLPRGRIGPHAAEADLQVRPSGIPSAERLAYLGFLRLQFVRVRSSLASSRKIQVEYYYGPKSGFL